MAKAKGTTSVDKAAADLGRKGKPVGLAAKPSKAAKKKGAVKLPPTPKY